MGNLYLLGEAVNRLKGLYWPLIKGRQTFMLTLTGVAGYLCQRPFPLDWVRFVSMAGSLLITISGCTILNMVFDRDLDREMTRTRGRPSAAEQFDARRTAYWGGALIALGVDAFCALLPFGHPWQRLERAGLYPVAQAPDRLVDRGGRAGWRNTDHRQPRPRCRPD
jgi:UbiA prenyltransferase family